MRDFPGGPVVKNLSCNAGDMGWIPGWGTRTPHTMEQLNLHTINTELPLKPMHSGAQDPQLLSPYATTTEVRVPRACALQQERTREACTTMTE